MSAEQIKKDLLEKLNRRDAHEALFIQAAEEIIEALLPVFVKDPKMIDVFTFIMEPERVVSFKVPWVDRNGKMQVNRGFRVQYSSAIGAFKGGCRFHPTVHQGMLKFLAFEQIFKNSLTGLPMGGGKGGADFDPKGKTDGEVFNFCTSFMTELAHHIGEITDCPAGDIGVGAREIGFMYQQYKRITKRVDGSLTGKGIEYGGSLIRPEATGYGCCYYFQNYMKYKKREIKGCRCLISGSGNVAQYTMEKLLEWGALPVTVSDSEGYMVCETGFTTKHLHELMELKNVARARLSTWKGEGCKFVAGKRPWEVKADYAFPSATQNEIDESDAANLLAGGCKGIFEGANMPTTTPAIKILEAKGVDIGPGKAANAGGVAVSGLEMTQNSMHLSWTREEVDKKLQDIMRNIFDQSVKAAEEYNVNLRQAANIAGFKKVAAAAQAFGAGL